MNKIIVSFIVFCFLLSSTSVSRAIGTNSGAWGMREQGNMDTVNLYDQGVEATKAGDYQKAMSLFKDALKTSPDNPDVLNMLAHTQLKLGMIDESLDGYKQALKLRPRFPEAREYLGEAYIQAAIREMETLKSYGDDGRKSLEDLTKAYLKSAERLKTNPIK